MNNKENINFVQKSYGKGSHCGVMCAGRSLALIRSSIGSIEARTQERCRNREHEALEDMAI